MGHQIRLAALATHWPGKLDWYWFQAVQRIARRMNMKSSVFDLGGQFLLPLYERDRPLTPMAARALWVATLSTDANARTPAIDIWIELINDGRADIDILSKTLWDITEWGVVKYVRLAGACYDIAPISALHRWTMAEIVQRHLGATKEFPRNSPALLTPLYDWLSSLGLALCEPLAEKLSQFRSGKSKKVAQELTALTEQPSPDREEAIRQSLDARFERAQRFS